MIANRPDWCISRQRSWGVPPFFLHKETGELHPRTMEILDQAPTSSSKGRHRGLEPRTAERSSAARMTPHYTKSSDILEVWFDSGSTFWHVLRGSHLAVPGQRPPEVDLYLEGHDQHRGWFHSSLLLIACALFSTARPTAACSRTASRWTARAAR